jgi:hypothetical protein
VDLSQAVINVIKVISSTVLDNVRLLLITVYLHLWIAMVMVLVLNVKPAITWIQTHHHVNPVRITVSNVKARLVVRHAWKDIVLMTSALANHVVINALPVTATARLVIHHII